MTILGWIRRRNRQSAELDHLLRIVKADVDEAIAAVDRTTDESLRSQRRIHEFRETGNWAADTYRGIPRRSRS